MSHRELSASGLVVGYGDREVLHGVDLVVPKGRRLALLGANGSGKTTLLRVLSGAIEPGAGQVAVDGVKLVHNRAGLRAHREAVQFVAQDPDDQLFAADVFRDVSFGPINLGLPDEQVRERVAHALEVLSITDLADRPIHELSYGQRKRVAMAGAMAMQPCVLLMDEPTAGLDPQGVNEMVDALAQLQADHTTVVISTHEVDFALGWADAVAILVDGRLHLGEPATMLGDADLVARARLRQPVVLQVAGRLGLPSASVTGVDALVDAIGAHR
ncbi:energy-coupling factor ABC transporter ATP-binding protein [Propioniciclava flava]